jgi:hypothetical protein
LQFVIDRPARFDLHHAARTRHHHVPFRNPLPILPKISGPLIAKRADAYDEMATAMKSADLLFLGALVVILAGVLFTAMHSIPRARGAEQPEGVSVALLYVLMTTTDLSDGSKSRFPSRVYLTNAQCEAVAGLWKQQSPSNVSYDCWTVPLQAFVHEPGP